MLTRTSEIAVKIMLHLVLHKSDDPVSPRVMAEKLDESPTYLAKITGILVKAGILRAQKGVTGGDIDALTEFRFSFGYCGSMSRKNSR